MTFVTVIQARLGSRRFPRKILAPLGPEGKAVIRWVVERAQVIGVPVIVACPINDAPAIISTCRGLWGPQVAVFPSSARDENDVLGRLADAHRLYPADALIRLTADSPFIDPDLIHDMMNSFTAHSSLGQHLDYLAPCFPAAACQDGGLDAEIVSAEALVDSVRLATEPMDREHATRYIWTQPHRFACRKHPEPEGYGTLGLRWMIDVIDDLERLDRIAKYLLPGELGWEQTRTAEVAANWSGR